MSPRWWQPRHKARKTAAKKTLAHQYRRTPWLEVLEDRTAPAVFNVPSGTEPGMNIDSLTAAITLADSNSDTSNIINVAPGTYTVVNLAIVAPPTKTLIIAGQGDGVTITAGGQDRVFTIDANVSFEDVTITDGKVQVKTGPNPEPAEGGGLLIDGGQVTLSNVKVTGNSVRGGNGSNAASNTKSHNGLPGNAGGDACGGGIYMTEGTLNLISSAVSSNRAIGGDGGNGAAAANGVTGAAGQGQQWGEAGPSGSYTFIRGKPGKEGGTGGYGGNGGNGGNAFGGGVYVAAGQVNINNLSSIDQNVARGGAGGRGGNGGMGGNGGTGAKGANSAGYTLEGARWIDLGTNYIVRPWDGANQHAGAGGGTGGPGGNGGNGGGGGIGGATNGGGLYLATGTVTLESSTINSNSLLGGVGGLGGKAGAGGRGGPGATGGNGGSSQLQTYDATRAGNHGGTGGLGGRGGNGGNGGFGGAGGPASGGGFDVAGGSLQLFGLTLDGNSIIGGNGGAAGIAGRGGSGGIGGNGGNAGLWQGANNPAGLITTGAGGVGVAGIRGGGGQGGSGGRGGNGGGGGAGGDAYGGGFYTTGGSLSLVVPSIGADIAKGGVPNEGGLGASGGEGGAGGAVGKGVFGRLLGRVGSAGAVGIAGRGGQGGVGGHGGTGAGGGAYATGNSVNIYGGSITGCSAIGNAGAHGGNAGTGSRGSGYGGAGGGGGAGLGGGIYLEAGSLSFFNEGTTESGGDISSNKAVGGAGGSAGNGGGATIGSPSVGGGEIGGQGGDGGQGSGGGIYVTDGGSLSIVNATVTGSCVGGAGGPASNAGNAAGERGGGVGGSGGTSFGGGICQFFATVALAGSSVSGDVTGGDGGQGGNGNFGGLGGNGGDGKGAGVYVVFGDALETDNTSISGSGQAGQGGPGGQGNGNAGQVGSNGTTDGTPLHGNQQPIAVQATQLVVSPMPPSLFADTPDQYPVYVVAEDANGNVDPDFSSTVTVDLKPNPDDATLDGTQQETASNGAIQEPTADGVAMFLNLSISTGGGTDTVAAVSGSLNGAYGGVKVPGFNAATIRSAYGINNLGQSPGHRDGTGETIAIIGYGDQSVLQGDVNEFDNAMYLENPAQTIAAQYSQPFLTVFYEQPDGSFLPSTNASVIIPAYDAHPYKAETEAALDVEWAHAIAPGANIVFIDCRTALPSDFYLGVSEADALSNPGTIALYKYTTASGTPLPPVSVVSMSEGIVPEPPYSLATALRNNTTFGTSGVTYIASTGDEIGPAGYPATSPNVIAVGGTTLSLNPPGTGTGIYNSETGWGAGSSNGAPGSSGGISVEPQPVYQQTYGPGIAPSTALVNANGTLGRATPDVSFDADDVNSPVAVFSFTPDSFAGAPTWLPAGGTSLGAPVWAGLMAIVNQGRKPGNEFDTKALPSGIAGQTVPSQQQALYALYSMPPSYFNHPPGGESVTGATISNGGSGYTSPPAVLFAGGGGSGAQGVAVLGTGIQAGQVVGITITNAGIGYTSPPSILLVGGFGQGAQVGSVSISWYNFVTGLGTPKANLLIPALIAFDPLQINESANFPTGTVGVTYDQTVTASGGIGPKTLTYTILSGAIPNGLTFNSTTSELDVTGTASASGIITFAVTATDVSGDSVTDTYTLTVNAAPVPVITRLGTAAGPDSGGSLVTVTGTGLAGATAVNFGPNPSTIVSDTDTQLVVTSPAGSDGSVDVTVTTAGGTSPASSSDKFTYLAPPVIASLSTSFAAQTGGTSLMINGTGLANATVVNFGTNAAAIVSDDGSKIVAISPPSSVGTVDVTVSTAGGTSATSSADQITYVPAPVVAAIAPAGGPIQGGTTVTITGTNLENASAVYFGSTPAMIVSDSDNKIVVTSPSGVAGIVDITVVTVGGTSGTSAADQFMYTPGPTVTGISPAQGLAAGGTTVTITGTNLSGVTAPVVGFGTNAAQVLSFSATQIVAISPAGAPGTVDVTVTTAGGVSEASPADQFTHLPLPIVTGLSPSSDPTGDGTSVVITGSGFTSATEVDFGDIAVTDFNIDSDTQITVNSPGYGDGAVDGTVDVTVVAANGASVAVPADQFTVGAGAAPTVSSIATASSSSAAGPVAGGTTVTIEGTDFAGSTAPVVDFGENAAQVLSYTTTQIVAVSPASVAGMVDVTVTATGGTSATSAADQFTYDGVPTITNISPATGPENSSTMVTLTGTGFLDTTGVSFGSTALQNFPINGFYEFTVESDTQIVAYSPAEPAGTVDVTVTGAAGSSAISAADQFTYLPPLPPSGPTVTNLSPASGPVAGGTLVTITGTNLARATAVYFGSTAATNIISDTAGQIVVDSPVGSLGTVDVTVVTGAGTSPTSLVDQFTYAEAPTITGITPASGPAAGGTWVLLTGTNLEDVSAVDFGGNAGTIESDAATQLLAMSPAGDAGTVDITVTWPGGTSATSAADQFTYEAAPSVTGVSPSTGPAAGGTTITIAGTDLANAIAVEFGANLVTDFISDTPTQITVDNPVGIGTVDVVVITAGGASSTSQADQFDYPGPTDTTPPTTTESQSGTLGTNGWYTSPVTVTLTASDSGSGVAETFYSLDGGNTWQSYTGAFTVTTQGSNTVEFYSVDNVGNVESTQSATFRIDTAPPTTTASVSGTAGTNGWYISPSVTVTLTATDTVSGVAATLYSVDSGTTWQTYTGPFGVSTQGSTTVEYYSVDNAGNIENTQSATLKIDSNTPVLTLPSNQTFIATQFGGALVNYTGASATDVAGPPTITYSQAGGTVFPLGTTTVAVTATNAAGLETRGSFKVTVVAAPADHLALAVAAPVGPGAGFSATATTLDPFGNTDVQFSGSVTLLLGSEPAGGKLSGAGPVPVVNGTAVFDGLSLNALGSYGLVALSTGDLIAASAPVIVPHAPVLKVSVAPLVAGENAAGQEFQVTVAAMLNGKPDSAYNGSVHVTSSDPHATFVTYQNVVNGALTFDATFNVPGRQTITVTDESLASITGTSGPATVTGTVPLGIDGFKVSGLAATDIAGTSHTVTVTAVNLLGQTVANYTGTVQLTSSLPGLTPISLDFTAANKGVVKVTVDLTTVGVQNLLVSDGNGHGGGETGINVVSPATHLAVTDNVKAGATVSAGGQVTITVTALTPAHQPDGQFADALQLSVGDPHALVAVQPSAAGVEEYKVTFKTAGTWTVSVADLTRPAITGPGLKVRVVPGSASQLVLASYPLYTVANVAHSFTVTAEDSFGNVVPSFSDSVSVAGSMYTFSPSRDHGVHTFNVAFVTLGGATLTASDNTNHAVQASSNTNITVISATVAFSADPLVEGANDLVVLAPAGGTVVITPANAAGTAVAVKINGNSQKMPAGPFARIVVYGQTGGDTVKEITATINNQTVYVDVPAIILGGSGADNLSAAGSNAANVLVGGPGNNTLSGGAGADILIAGGAATLNAGKGGDILIGGSTTNDANVAALAAMAAEWDSGGSYQQRVDDLFGNSLNPTTMIRDTAASQLTGGGGLDWFWLSEGSKTRDILKIYGTGDVATFA